MSSDNEDFEQLHELPTERQQPINEKRRFLLLVLGTLASVCVSFSYAFNLIAQPMQERYHLSQRDLSTITTVGLALQYFCLPYAFIYDYLGPLVILALATLYFTIGTLLLALCFMNKITGSVVRLAVFNAFMGCGCVLFDLGSCMTVMLHFPANKGVVIALLKTYTGLGSAIVGAISLGFFSGHTDWYFFFLMAFAALVGILCMIFLRLPTFHLTGYEETHLSDAVKAQRHMRKAQYLRQYPSKHRLYYAFIIIGFFIIFLPTTSALATYLNLSSNYKLAFAVVTCIASVLYTLMPLPFPCFADEKVASEETDSCDVESNDIQADNNDGDKVTGFTREQIEREQNQPSYLPDDSNYTELPPAGKHATENENNTVSPSHSTNVVHETEIDYIAPQYQGTFLHNLLTPDLWALWWSFFAVVGSEFVIIFNASYLLGALAGEMPSRSLSTLLTVINGVGSAVGRLIMSYVETKTQRRKAEVRIPLTFCMFLPNVSIIFALVLFLVLPARALPFPYAIAALGNGFLAANTILMMRTLYAKDAGKHYNYCFTATMTAAVVLNRFLYGEWYSRKAEQLGNSSVCLHKTCVLVPVVVLIVLCCTSFLSSAFVHIRYTRFCRRVLAERKRLLNEGEHNVNVPS